MEEALEKAIPGTLGKTSLELNENITIDQWLKVGETLKTMHQCILFWLGDWLMFGEKNYGEMYSQALDVTEYTYGTLRNAVWVCSKIEKSRRLDNLSFSHHAEVAKLDEAEQVKYLKEALKKNLSTKDLRSLINENHREIINVEGLDEMGYKEYKKAMLEIGAQYADFWIDQGKLIGLDIRVYSSQKRQYDTGETPTGIEIKFDRQLEKYGNLWIEFEEKADQDRPDYTPSGIYRRNWLYIIGDYTEGYVFAVKKLRAMHEAKIYEEKENNTQTSKGFLVPREAAREKSAVWIEFKKGVIHYE